MFGEQSDHLRATKSVLSVTTWVYAFRTLGIVYGDIGTSPLYVLKSIFTEAPSESDVIGALSLIIYSLMVLVTLKYMVFILMADNHGEGGTFALLGLIQKGTLPNTVKSMFLIAALGGAAFVMGDGALTPAISVLGALEGIDVAAPGFHDAIMPLTIVILILLFAGQRFGTAKVSLVFSPICALWFFSIGAIGIWRITENPSIFKAFNPAEGIMFLVREGTNGFLSLGAIFLAVTGLEALYADIGHLGVTPVRLTWCGFVLPALILNYLGQGALLLNDPSTISDPFYLSTPESLYWPMIILATAATVIASQAMITGCFSLVAQAVSLNCFPPISVVHTSKKVFGQVYVPVMNWVLLVMTIIIVVIFQSSSSIGHAYGVTVCSVMILTTVMFSAVLRWTWGHAWWKVVPFALILLPIDTFFFASNLAKIPEGGWIAIIFGCIFATFMICWHLGEMKTAEYRAGQDSKLDIKKLKAVLKSKKLNQSINVDKVDEIMVNFSGEAAVGSPKLATFNGMGVFVGNDDEKTPTVFNNVVRKMHVMATVNVFLNVQIAAQPKVNPDGRVNVDHLEDEVYKVTARYGFAEFPIEVEDILEEAKKYGLPEVPADQITYFLDKEFIQVTDKNPFKRIIYQMYAFLKRTFNGTRTLILPPISVINMGALITV